MTIETDVHELLDRTRRLETRIVQLGDYVGANLRTKARIEIVRTTAEPYVKIDSLDVSTSRILTELRQANLHPMRIDVYCNDLVVCTLFPIAARRSAS